MLPSRAFKAGVVGMAGGRVRHQRDGQEEEEEEEEEEDEWGVVFKVERRNSSTPLPSFKPLLVLL